MEATIQCQPKVAQLADVYPALVDKSGQRWNQRKPREATDFRASLITDCEQADVENEEREWDWRLATRPLKPAKRHYHNYYWLSSSVVHRMLMVLSIDHPVL